MTSVPEPSTILLLGFGLAGDYAHPVGSDRSSNLMME